MTRDAGHARVMSFRSLIFSIIASTVALSKVSSILVFPSKITLPDLNTRVVFLHTPPGGHGPQTSCFSKIVGSSAVVGRGLVFSHFSSHGRKHFCLISHHEYPAEPTQPYFSLSPPTTSGCSIASGLFLET